jgi:hypothetical protein
MRVGTPFALCPSTKMRITFIPSIILSFALVPTLGHAQVESEAAPDPPASSASEEATETGAPAEATEPPEPAAAEPEPAEPVAAAPEEPDKPNKPEPSPAAPATAPATIQTDAVVAPQPEAPPPAPEPAGHMHDGFYLRGSIGPGLLWTRFTNGILDEENISGRGGAFDLQLGGTPSPGLVVGGGLFFGGMEHEAVRPPGAAAEDGDPGSVGLMAIGPFVDYYPDPKGGLHFGGMLGLAAMGFDTPSRDGGDSPYAKEARGGGGGALGAWIGHDWWIAREWSLGVQLRYLGVSVKNEDYDWNGAADTLSLQFTALYH